MVNNTISSLSYVVVSEMASEGPALGLDGWKKPERILGSLEKSWRPLKASYLWRSLASGQEPLEECLEVLEGPWFLSGVFTFGGKQWQAVLVARETGSCAGPIMGATNLVAVLRRGQVETFCHRGQGVGAAHHRRWTA